MSQKFVIGSCVPIQNNLPNRKVRFQTNDAGDETARQWIFALLEEINQLKERIAQLEAAQSEKSFVN